MTPADRPLRIGLVTGEYPPMEGGVGAFTQALAQALHALGHAVTVISRREARPPDVQLTARQLNEPIDLGYAQLLARARRWNRPEMHIIADMAVRYELDVVNIQYQAAAYNMRNPAINFLPWRLRGVAPAVVTFHDLRVPYIFPKAGALRTWVVQRMAQQAAGAIATNPADAAVLRTWQVGRLAQIAIGSNIAPHAPDAATIAGLRAGLGLTDDAALLAYFGFANPSKGADVLVEALAQLPTNAQLVFIGGQTGASDPANNAAFLAQIRAQIAARGVQPRVHWTGFVPDAAVSAWLHAADLVVLPYRDGVSLRRGTLMAALAHGRPLITTHPPDGPAALVDGETAYLVPPDDPAALVAAVQALMADATLRARLGRQAAAFAAQFSWEHIARQTVDFYRAVLGA